MRSKVQWASAMALAATVFTALFSAQGSGAAASEMIPTLVEQKPKVEFVSQPVVQPLAKEGEKAPAEEAVETAPESEVTTLAQLVSEQSMPGKMSRQMRCLAGAIYFEARGETLEGQLAVGRVIVNRAASDRFPDSYCGVVYQRSQFSFVRGRSMPTIREHSDSWRRAVAIAQIAQADSWVSPAKGALFFHAARVSPKWRLTRVGRIDNHIFYR
ncbi:MAG: cell wall hydrolase [Novosphingobium sp.]|jgi:N-acetylmuramoyl-L-alanine amidase